MSYLNIQNLWKEYGDQIVLEQINNKVEKGDFVTIVGASGCGKTTFLKMLLGTETPSRGQILLDGQPIASEPNEERGIVFQRYSVFPHMTVLENVMLSRELESSPILGRLFGKQKKQAAEDAKQMIELVGLSHALNKYPHELSGGMQQRLALAQSLIKKPRILLLDEPFGALDPGIRTDMHQLVLKLWKEHQLTIFMITHDIKEGFFLGTRLWVFDKDRFDPQAPNAYGAKITYDLPVGDIDKETYQQIDQSLTPSEPEIAEAS
ncbi:NitT/TauT family transport system ATP-binding protein [Alteromonadaceae bacterium Bs31]|nr:NitT/TauT family transport system ATP-binding protein [Alteromonadaceae bacterium Bs31]